MFLIILAIGILAVVLSNALFWPRVRPRAFGDMGGEFVSVLVPARDEERNIGSCLESILRQGSRVGEVLVYDDHSTDATSRIVLDVSRTDARVRMVTCQPLPPDWCGKNFACARLADSASGDWLLFLDADARLAPDAVNGMIATATERKLTMLSCWPGFALVSFAERALMPMLNFIVFTIFPALLALIRKEPSLGLAHGACLLLRRETYERLGGHSSVRGEIFEDTRLAQWWRENGERSVCLDGQDVVSVRMYASFSEIWLGFQKNFFPAFRHEWMFWLFLLFQITAFLMPFVLRNWSAAALILVARMVLCLRFSQPLWSVLLHPIAELLVILLGLSSWWHCRSGRGVAWKGRVYRASRV